MKFKEEKILVGFKAEKSFVDKIDKIALKEGVDRSKTIRVLLEEGIRQYELTKK